MGDTIKLLGSANNEFYYYWRSLNDRCSLSNGVSYGTVDVTGNREGTCIIEMEVCSEDDDCEYLEKEIEVLYLDSDAKILGSSEVEVGHEIRLKGYVENAYYYEWSVVSGDCLITTSPRESSVYLKGLVAHQECVVKRVAYDESRNYKIENTHLVKVLGLAPINGPIMGETFDVLRENTITLVGTVANAITYKWWINRSGSTICSIASQYRYREIIELKGEKVGRCSVFREACNADNKCVTASHYIYVSKRPVGHIPAIIFLLDDDSKK